MKHILLLLLSALPFSIFAQQTSKPDFSLAGYAATITDEFPEGTTGGKGGKTVTPTTVEELKKFCSAAEPLIIQIEREFKGPAIIRMGSNKTLIGIEDKGFINQISLNINCQKNIIIRNIRFTMTGVPITNNGENKIIGTTTDPDCIAMQADDEDLPEDKHITSHIWIDHCEFFNENPYVMTDYDRYDGLVDSKNNCTNITISWNYFHDHHKACLIGKGGNDKYDRHITFHHNYFKNIKSRLPLCRFGHIHFLNNYIDDCNDGTNARINTELCIEANVYKDSKKPVFGKIAEDCKANLINNRFVNCKKLPAGQINEGDVKFKPLAPAEEFGPTDFKPLYNYEKILTDTKMLPEILEKWTGVNKL